MLDWQVPKRLCSTFHLVQQPFLALIPLDLCFFGSSPKRPHAVGASHWYGLDCSCSAWGFKRGEKGIWQVSNCRHPRVKRLELRLPTDFFPTGQAGDSYGIMSLLRGIDFIAQKNSMQGLLKVPMTLTHKRSHWTAVVLQMSGVSSSSGPVVFRFMSGHGPRLKTEKWRFFFCVSSVGVSFGHLEIFLNRILATTVGMGELRM